jgi:Trm5-related predicted tRNA methylase
MLIIPNYVFTREIKLCDFPKTRLQHENLTFVSYDFPGTPLILVDLTNRSENFKVKESKAQLTSFIKETCSYVLNSLEIHGLVAKINGSL